MSKLEQASKETARAWKWIQENMDQFEKEVYGPPIVSCSVKDQRYTHLVESALNRTDFCVITAQTSADAKKLNDQLYGVMGLADVPLRKADDFVWPHPQVSPSDMRRLGFDGWASDLIDGPQPVISMLCSSTKLHQTAVALEDVSEGQHHMITQNEQIGSWITGQYSFRVARRREYGPGAVSTSTRRVFPARYWTDQPVDSTVKRELEQKIQQLAAELQELKDEIEPVRESLQSLQSQGLTDVENEIVCLANNYLLSFANLYV